jgi:release factor glutamine methyltransferase
VSPASAFFRDVWVIVHDGVYEPAEDTFLLCEHLDVGPTDRVLELGCGCGLISIIAAKRGALVVATDNSPLAVQNTQENVERHKLQGRVDVRLGHLFEPIRSDECFSTIIFNPPYLPGTKAEPGFDPRWSGGSDGRQVTDAFLTECHRFLDTNGAVLLVQSSLSNPDKTRQILCSQFRECAIRAERAFFFERLLLFEARYPRNRRHVKNL